VRIEGAQPLQSPFTGEAASARDGEQGVARSPLQRVREFHSRPFFDDKDQAFWILHSIGWAGFFVLRVLNGIATAQPVMFAVHRAVSFCSCWLH
jgi:hypothetical protein